MKHLLLLLVFCLTAAAGPAQTLTPGGQVAPPQAPQTEEEEEEPGRVEGSVVLAGSETPVRKARVMLYSRERRMPQVASTGEGGKFLFEDVPPGEYHCPVTHSRYVTSEDDTGGLASLQIISVSAGERVQGLVFKMIPGAVVTGRIFDEYGDPQPQARVSLLKYVYRGGEKQLMPVGGGDSSDDRGVYRVFNIQPGRYYLSVEYQDRESSYARIASPAAEQDSAYPPVFYPGVLEPETAMELDLKAGEERQGIDLRLVLDRAVRVSGRVLVGGKPASDAFLLMRPKEGFNPRLRRNQPVDRKTGEFELSGVRPGRYILAGMTRGSGSEGRLVGRTEVEVASSNVEGVVVALLPGVDISGELRIEGESASSFSFEEQQVRVALRPVGGVSFGSSGPGRVGEDGSFVLKSVEVGAYQVRLYPVPEGGYVAGVVFGDQDVTGKEIEVQPGMTGPLRLRVRLAAATINGTVKDDDGQPVLRARILIAPEPSKRDREDLFKYSVTDQYGSFSAKGIAPGEYRVWAISKIEMGQHLNPDFLASIEDKGEKVEADENGVYSVELELTEAPQGF